MTQYMNGSHGIIIDLEGVFNILPTRDQIPENIKEQLIVELYSK